jgi:predicted ATPase/DNA-binding SARP family transcriptional activator
MRFGVLGPLTVWTGDGAPVEVPGRKVRALLADLLAHAGQVVSVDRLVEDLWRDRPPAHPANVVQGKVSQLRRALGPGHPVVSRGGGYLVDVDDLDTDVDSVRFARLAARARNTGDPRTRAALLGEALRLWRGPAFADHADEPFAAAAIARLTEDRLLAVEEHAEARLALGEHRVVATELGELAATHPGRERLRAAHLRALYAAGRQREALDGYAELRTYLADELGADPSPQLQQLHQAILRQDPGLTPAPAPRTNLPAPARTLVGRDDAVAELGALLGTERLVTLTGEGGVGKTRLALAVAATRTAADGVWFVEASTDPAGDLRRIMGTADVGDREILLVLDNCEHVLDESAGFVAALLAAPGTRVLATSREPLGLSAERGWRVPPLEPPADDDPATMLKFSAARLFADRAGITVDDGNAAAVATLCRRLDGLPLAIELAAARVRTLGVHGLLARLDDRFAMLTGGYRDAPPRQRTLRAVIDWSWDLLTDAEQRVLRRLAVHADGATVAAVEAVGGVPDVLDLLACLVDRSLVYVADCPDGPRYQLTESVRDYCLERLRDAGELAETRARHVDHYTALAVRAAPFLHGPDQRRWLTRLDDDGPNLRLALAHATPPRATTLAHALTWYWVLRGHLAEAMRAFDDIPGVWRTGFAQLTGAPATPASPATAREAAFLAMARFDAATADQALAGDDPWAAALAVTARARHALANGDHEAARRDAARGAAGFTDLGDGWGQLQASFPLATLDELAGRHAAAAARYRAGVTLAEELGLWPEAVRLLCGLARTGPADSARETWARALRLAEERGDRDGADLARQGLA